MNRVAPNTGRKTARITISLPVELLEQVEEERKGSGETRSELFRRALETLFEKQRYEKSVSRYVEGYVAEPESEYEIAAAEVTEAGAFEADEDWE